MHAFSRDFSIIGPVFFNQTQLFCIMPQGHQTTKYSNYVRLGLEACLDNLELP